VVHSDDLPDLLLVIQPAASWMAWLGEDAASAAADAVPA